MVGQKKRKMCCLLIGYPMTHIRIRDGLHEMNGQEAPHLRLEVGADSNDAPLDSHLKGETYHPPDLQQGLFAQSPATLFRV